MEGQACGKGVSSQWRLREHEAGAHSRILLAIQEFDATA